MKKLLVISLLILSACTKESPKVSSEALQSLDLVGSPLNEVVDSSGIKTFVLNIKNTGDEDALNVPVSLSGGQDSSFQLLTSSCPEIKPNIGSCAIRLRFDPKGKANDTYQTSLVAGDLITPISVVLNLPVIPSNTFDLRVFNQSGEIDHLSFINLGKSSGSSISRVFSIKNINKTSTASALISLTQNNPDFSLNKSSCEKEELNSNQGCQVRLIFKASSVGIKTAALRVENHDRLNLQGELVASSIDSQTGTPILSFEKDSSVITNFNFNTVIVPESRNVKVKIKNSGNGTAGGQLSITPANLFYVTGNTCKIIGSNSECEFQLRLSSTKKVSGLYQATLSFNSISLSIEASLMGNDCLATEHIDPITYQCVVNDQTESLANGSRSRSWVTTPAPGSWGDWSYSCDQHYENVGEECLGVYYTLTLNKTSGGSVQDGENVFCDENCSNQTVSYQYPKTITLSASALISHNLTSWSDTSCTGSICSVTLDSDKSIDLNFSIKQFQLTINQSTGGSISGSSGIYDYGTNLNFSTTSDIGYEFLNYNGDCSGANCSFEMTSDKTISASFGTLANSITIITPSRNVLKSTGCSQAITAEVRDINGQLLNRASATQFNLTGSNISYYSDSSCSSLINSISLVNSGTFSVYIKSNILGSKSILIGDVPNQLTTSQNAMVYDALLISPSSGTIMANTDLSLSVSGGIGPFTWSKVSGVGSINSSSGLFSAGAVAGPSLIKVTDTVSLAEATISITVNAQISLALGTCSSAVETMNCSVSASGGVGSYSYQTTQGTISSLGVFNGQCSANTGSALITVTDSSANTAQLTINYPCVYQSCNQIKADGYGLTSGNYYVDLDTRRSGADPIQVYCELNSTANVAGLTLLASGGSSCGVSNMIQRSSGVGLSASSCGYLPDATVRTISASGQQVNLRSGASHSSYSEAVSTGTNTLVALRTGATWHNGAQSEWSAFSWTWGCSPIWATGWPNMFHACNNGAGVHWLINPSGNSYLHSHNAAGAQVASSTWIKVRYNKHAGSCLEAKNNGQLNSVGTSGSGIYTLDVDGYGHGQAPFSAYCDMSTDSGGWQLVASAWLSGYASSVNPDIVSLGQFITTNGDAKTPAFKEMRHYCNRSGGVIHRKRTYSTTTTTTNLSIFDGNGYSGSEVLLAGHNTNSSSNWVQNGSYTELHHYYGNGLRFIIRPNSAGAVHCGLDYSQVGGENNNSTLGQQGFIFVR